MSGVNVWVFLGVLVFTFGMDAFYVRYLQAVGASRPALAASFSALTHLSVVADVGAVLHDRRYLAAVILGSWAGTYLSVRHKRG